MLLPDIDEILKYRIVLSSGSVNRRNILKNCGLDFEKDHFEVIPSGFAEDLPKEDFDCSKDYVIKTSEMKLEYSINHLPEKKEGDDRPWIFITADTIISIDEKEVLEKP